MDSISDSVTGSITMNESVAELSEIAEPWVQNTQFSE